MNGRVQPLCHGCLIYQALNLIYDLTIAKSIMQMEMPRGTSASMPKNVKPSVAFQNRLITSVRASISQVVISENTPRTVVMRFIPYLLSKISSACRVIAEILTPDQIPFLVDT